MSEEIVSQETVAPETVADDTEATLAPQQEADPTQAAAPDSVDSNTDEDLAKQAFFGVVDPKAKKELNRYFTQRTQKLSAREKELAQAEQIYRAIQSDPASTVKYLAQQVGLQIAEPPQSAVQREAVDEARVALESALGPELAQALLPAVEKVAERVASKQLDPMRRFQEEQIQKAAFESTKAALESFSAKRPDWQKHEAKMVELGRQFLPAKGMNEAQWLDALYTLATSNEAQSRAAQKVVEQMQRSARASESPAPGVAPSRVSTVPPKFANIDAAFDAAFEAAKRGERWEA